MTGEIKIAWWIRWGLFATGALNLLGALIFLPPLRSLRDLNGFPPDPHPLFLSIIASWIFLFGVCYFWLSITGRQERLFIAIGAMGKIAFVVIMAAFAVSGDIPISTALSSLPDLIFGSMFIIWLWVSQKPAQPAR